MAGGLVSAWEMGGESGAGGGEGEQPDQHGGQEFHPGGAGSEVAGEPRRMSYAGTLRTAGWQSLSWLLFGPHAWVLVVGLGAASAGTTLAVSVGGFALSYGIGPLFVLTPAGAGVREAALVLTLGALVGGATALAVALASRMILLAADFAQAGLWSAAARRGVRAARLADLTVPDWVESR